jgi:hypothetical protein
VVVFRGPVETLPDGNGPLASVREPSLTVIDVALFTFQLSVTEEPGVTVLELAVKLPIVGGWTCGGGGEDAFPDPHPAMIDVVKRRRRAGKKHRRARVLVTFVPFRGTRSRQGEYLRVLVRSSGSGWSCQLGYRSGQYAYGLRGRLQKNKFSGIFYKHAT